MEPSVHDSLADQLQKAQELAFAPISFVTAMALRRLGLLDALYQNLRNEVSLDELARLCHLSVYATTVLVESGVAIKALTLKGEFVQLSKLGHILHRDPMTITNMDFVYHVCYQGLFHFEESLKRGEPCGLSEISSKKTVYEGLATLSPETKNAWFQFDHFYSDSAFAQALSAVFGFFKRPFKLLDIGGNTGRFAKMATENLATLRVTIADLPQQIELARKNLAQLPTLQKSQIDFFATDLLHSDSRLPEHFDAVWMSQFLVCFDEATVSKILAQAKSALTKDGYLFILDTFWDLQDHEIANFCLKMTTPYFTCIANGNSRIYTSEVIIGRAKNEGLKLDKIIKGLGLSHSLLVFKKEEII